MIQDITITVLPEQADNKTVITAKALEALLQKGIKADADSMALVFIRKSIDARHGQLKLCLRYKAYINEDPAKSRPEQIPEWKKTDGRYTVILIGAGPAGLFGALRLLENGIKPVIVERGGSAAERKKDIAAISTKNSVDKDSNYCFGAGGAGTFSDGKLYTRSNKRGDIHRILRIFTAFGADSRILTDAHPHIGTDRLPSIITALQKKIEECGGEFYFHTRCTSLTVENGAVTGIRCVNTKNNTSSDFSADAVVLAAGQSAADIYHIMAAAAPASLEAKTFAVGVRVEHPRQLIDRIQYHGKAAGDSLGAAEYRLTAQENGRGVYSFCMCPGGFVVPSATGPDEIVVNGMSSAARNSAWSNAAIVVEIRPEDIPQQFKEEAEKQGCPVLAGLLFRNSLEKKAKLNGNGQAAPAQRLMDFLEGRDSKTLPKTSYTPGIVPSRLDLWLPEEISDRLKAGFKDFDRNMHGFICPEALLIAVETRTSTPVRISRNKDTMECNGLRNLYPAGEGAGYSGGIVSSAMDGEKVCSVIIKKLEADHTVR
ncbi:MAG: FAD-binding protein [Treponema sp.]|jgi:uncharacterized FAD-dependent dehydrogenase|nr:FAD-binding protein [Treponema sp.]